MNKARKSLEAEINGNDRLALEIDGWWNSDVIPANGSGAVAAVRPGRVECDRYVGSVGRYFGGGRAVTRATRSEEGR